MLLVPNLGIVGSQSVGDTLCALGFGCNRTQGCTQPVATNYDSLADLDDNSCLIVGCTDPESPSFNPAATIDDGCHGGCTSPAALNYDSDAIWMEGNCTYTCNDRNALNFGHPSACIARVAGCLVPTASNYDSHANTADNSQCIFVWPPPSPAVPPPPFGCTDPGARNFDSLATALGPNTPCTYSRPGCTDSTALNFQSFANDNDGSCITRQP